MDPLRQFLCLEIEEEQFPGIMGYYRELKDKPSTFLELLWGFTHRDGGCVETVQVATAVAIRRVAR